MYLRFEQLYLSLHAKTFFYSFASHPFKSIILLYLKNSGIGDPIPLLSYVRSNIGNFIVRSILENAYQEMLAILLVHHLNGKASFAALLRNGLPRLMASLFHS